MDAIQPFQRRFLAGVRRHPISCFSAPRGAGKTTLAAMLAARAFAACEAGEEVAIIAGSVNQGRTAFRMARRFLGENGYRYTDSSQRCVAKRKDGSTMAVMAASGRTAMGMVRVPFVVCDEPAAWRQNDGALLWDAISTAVGKPESPMRVVLAGTLAPLGLPGHWWHDLIHRPPHEGYFVELYQGDAERWDDLRHIYQVNPLSRVSADFRATLRRERDEAREDSRLKARFLSYRLNIPSADESKVLLTTGDWRQVIAREVPDRDGQPVVGIDLGGGRAWSSAVAIWPNGRCEATALCGGVPDIPTRERMDRVPPRTYSKLIDAGVLHVDEELRVPRVSRLIDLVRGWGPVALVGDFFRWNDLQDAVQGRYPIQARRQRWSESAEDIRATRKMAVDGTLAVEERSRALLGVSLASAVVENDSSGGMRLVKRDPGRNTGRDDVAAALAMACGAASRRPPAAALKVWSL